MNYKHIDWCLRRRACERYGHKSDYPCSRCGVAGEGMAYDVSALFAEKFNRLVIAEYICQPNPIYQYLKSH